MAVQERLYTAAELLALPRDKCRYELVKGHLIELPFHGMVHGVLTANIGSLLYGFVELHELGKVFSAGTGYKLESNPDTVYGIDASFVTKVHDRGGEGYLDGAP